MGEIRMEVREVGRYPDSYPMEDVVLYVYCDRCGSFGIDAAIEIPLGSTLLLIIVAGIVFMLVGSSPLAGPYPNAHKGTLLYVFLALIVLVMVIATATGRGSLTIGHRCRKCGNTDITDRNVLNYPEYDKSIVDVPEERVHTHQRMLN